VRGASPTVFGTERERVRGPTSVAAADIVAFFGIVCTSTRSKPNSAVETLGVTLLTHCAVRINRPKTEHGSRSQNAPIRTRRENNRLTEANCLASVHVWRRNAVKHTFRDTPSKGNLFCFFSCARDCSLIDVHHDAQHCLTGRERKGKLGNTAAQ